MKKIILFTFIASSLVSCRLILSKLYGVNTLKKFDQKKCEKFIASIDKKGIKTYALYADTNSYNCVRKIPPGKKLRKDFSQPVQILYFDGDSLVSFHANCYAQGSISNLDWNVNNRFNRFTPVSAIPMDSARFTISDFARCYTEQKPAKEKRYTVIIYWSLMLEKISKTAIRTVIDNIVQFNKTEETVIFLVNNDQSFIGN